MFTIVVNSTDPETLTRWSKRLFAVFYTCGSVGFSAGVIGCVLGWLGKPPWLWLGLIAFALAMGAVQGVTEKLGDRIDEQRNALLDADKPTQPIN